MSPTYASLVRKMKLYAWQVPSAKLAATPSFKAQGQGGMYNILTFQPHKFTKLSDSPFMFQICKLLTHI